MDFVIQKTINITFILVATYDLNVVIPEETMDSSLKSMDPKYRWALRLHNDSQDIDL